MVWRCCWIAFSAGAIIVGEGPTWVMGLVVHFFVYTVILIFSVYFSIGDGSV